MDRKGQGALEYLLLIGGAVLVAAIVIALITGIPGTQNPASEAECAAKSLFAECTATGSGCVALQIDGVTTATSANFAMCRPA